MPSALVAQPWCQICCVRPGLGSVILSGGTGQTEPFRVSAISWGGDWVDTLDYLSHGLRS